MSSNVPVELQPKPAFCIKTTTLQSGSYAPSARASDQYPSSISLRPRVPVPQGLKVFVNVAWDSNVPPPPKESEQAITAAVLGEPSLLHDRISSLVPVVISDGRQDTDKASRPCLVFDAVYSASLKSRALKDTPFKLFLLELALQRIEEQTTLSFSREIAIPRLLSKGALEVRSVLIPADAFPSPLLSSLSSSSSPSPARKLIEEIPSPARKLIEEIPSPVLVDESPPKKSGPGSAISSVPSPGTSISKGRLLEGSNTEGRIERLPSSAISSRLQTPSWTWSNSDSSIEITIQVPGLTRTLFSEATLDIGPRRLLFLVPALYSLDIDLSLPDAELSLATRSDPASMATLKGMDEFDVDSADAEWRLADDVLVVSVRCKRR